MGYLVFGVCLTHTHTHCVLFARLFQGIRIGKQRGVAYRTSVNCLQGTTDTYIVFIYTSKHTNTKSWCISLCFSLLVSLSNFILLNFFSSLLFTSLCIYLCLSVPFIPFPFLSFPVHLYYYYRFSRVNAADIRISIRIRFLRLLYIHSYLYAFICAFSFRTNTSAQNGIRTRRLHTFGFAKTHISDTKNVWISTNKSKSAYKFAFCEYYV